MKIDFDPRKDEANRTKHGIGLAQAARLDWSAVLWKPDERSAYGEPRCVGVGPIDDRLFDVVYGDRGPVRRIISLRRANAREVRRYAEDDQDP